MVARVSIIILNYNGVKDTIECLESLKKIDYPNYEIIVIDNGSFKEEAQILEEYTNKNIIKNIIIIRNKENLGFTGGNNVGIKIALERNSDYILFLNNDTVVERYFLKEMVEVASLNQEVILVGATIFDYFSHKPTFSGGKIDKKLKILIWKNTPQENKKYFFSDIISGACFLIKTKDLIKNSLFFDESLFLYGEEIDLCWRVNKLGYKIAIASRAKVYHKEGKSLGKGLNYLKVYYITRNRILLAKKFLKGYNYFLFWVLFFISRAIRTFHFIFILRWDLIKGNWRGILDGLLNKTGKFIK